MSFKVFGQIIGESKVAVPFAVSECGDTYTVTVKRDTLIGKKFNHIRIESDLTTVPAGDGYMFYPTNFNYGYVLTYLREREDSDFRHHPSTMPVAGISLGESSVYIQALGCSIDCRFHASCKNNVYTLTPEFVFNGDDPVEDVSIIYKKMPGATYSDMAKAYRDYQLNVVGCEPITEKVKTRPAVKFALEGLELRIRMGWKPQPTPVRHQTLENEPEMYVACTIKDLEKLIDKMKENGIEGVELCLVGWAAGGHDGRFPQHYPTDERFGTDEELRAFITRANSMGYTVSCHSNCMGAYEIANNFDWDKIIQKPDENGNLTHWVRTNYQKAGLQGGEPYHVCAKFAYETYAKNDFPIIRDYGFSGLHYVDEISACEPVKCYAKDHPTTRQDVVKYYSEIAKLSCELFGGSQSEAWFDFANKYMDYSLYTSVKSKIDPAEAPVIFDEIIPFFVLVYHGIVMSNAASATINYPIKAEFERLRAIEFGSRPLLYINSKFCGRDWMGKEDLYCNTDSAIDNAVSAMKKAQDDYAPLRHLQYCFMEDHRKIADGVYRITYSNGETIEVDYNKGDYYFV